MKRSDLETLKKMLDGTEFEVITNVSFNNETVFAVKKKDTWDGVEFIDRGGTNWPICKVHRITDDEVRYFNQNGSVVFMYKKDIKPSNEQAYIEQLKRIAFEKFPVINKGDKFSINDSINEIPQHCGKSNYIDYDKKTDSLFYQGVLFYQQGKWATKLPERIKVDWKTIHGNEIVFTFSKMPDITPNEIRELMKVMEEYLNK
jgi:hypothetical protein